MTSTLSRLKDGPVSYLRGGSGRALVLLHGIPGSAHTWESVAERVTNHFDVIVPDLLGFGESDPPPGDFYMRDQAVALKAFLDRLGVDQLVLAGHDFGSQVALTLTRLFPDLVVHGLVLSATNTFTDTYVPPSLRLARVPVLGDIAFWAMAGSRPALWVTYQAGVRRKREVSWHQFARHLTPSGVRYTRRIFQRNLSDLTKNYAEIEASLASISCPTLVLWGDRDPFFTVEEGRRTQQAVPGATLTVFEDTGHFVPEEQPAQVSSEIIAMFS